MNAFLLIRPFYFVLLFYSLSIPFIFSGVYGPACSVSLPPSFPPARLLCSCSAEECSVRSFSLSFFWGEGGGGFVVAGRSAAEGVCADWGVESCCIALLVPGVDPVVRANWEQFVIPLSGVRFGRRGGCTAAVRPREWAIK